MLIVKLQMVQFSIFLDLLVNTLLVLLMLSKNDNEKENKCNHEAAFNTFATYFFTYRLVFRVTEQIVSMEF